MVHDPTESSGTLLDYDLDADPDPLRVGRAARLKLVAFNRTDDPIDVARILVTLPVGPGASDLVAAGTQIEVGPPEHWQASVDGGTISLTPDGGKAAVADKSLEFTIAITPNGEAGAATVLLTETAASPYEPSQPRTVSFDNAKYPQDFTLELRTVPPDLSIVQLGERATLMWEGTGDRVQCTLSYVPDDSGNVVTKTVSQVGTMTTEPLTRKDGVTFVLVAEQNVVGQDNPRVLERRLDLKVASLSLKIFVEPPNVAPNGLVRLRWNASNADHCVLDDGAVHPPVGFAYFVVSADREFTVLACAAGSEPLQAQARVTVDTSIAPTEQGYSVTGAQGLDGPSGTDVYDDFEHCSDGREGGAGGDARLQRSLPPLATVGHGRVIPIRLTGGKGGTGGTGDRWDPEWNGNPYEIRNSGPGGQGGRAILDVTLDQKDTVPAQYIITLRPGPGGDGGPRQDGGSNTKAPGGPGPTGPIGSVSATIDGKDVALP